MYKGTLIDELISIVERAEERARETDSRAELERWYAAQHQTRVQADLLGVA